MEQLSWEFRNVMSIKEEPHAPDSELTMPQIIASPTTFEYADYVGSMNTWDDFGK